MKILKGNMVLEDLSLKKGEVFQVGTGKKSFKMKYEGHDDGPEQYQSGSSKWHHLTTV